MSTSNLPRAVNGVKLLALCSLALPQVLTAAFSTDIVYFDLPEALEPSPIPAPTADLLALPGYSVDVNQLTLAAQIYVPDPLVFGDGPYPVVLILHGSGGLWSNDEIDNGPLSQFKQWGEELVGMGYLVLLPDSYNPRGIPANYGSRRPHYDPAIDDDLCSPNYERPKDVIAALTYLDGRADVDRDNIALMGFSHGAQTAMNSVLDVSVDLGDYEVSYIDLVEIEDTEPVEYEEDSVKKPVASPVRIPGYLPFPKLGFFYYGGGSHYGYHGQASSVATGRYMIDRRMKALMFHGTEDSLLDVDDPDVTPMTGDLYPIKQALSSSAQAALVGVPDPLQHHFILDHVNHSFDLVSMADVEDWDTENESPDQLAKRLCREEVKKWLEAELKPSPATLIVGDVTPGHVDLTASTNARLKYQWIFSDDLADWDDLDSAFNGDGGDMQADAMLGGNNRRFFRLEYGPIPPPFLNYPDFFRVYDDFSY